MRGDEPIDENADVLDSRDVIDRIEYIERELECAEEDPAYLHPDAETAECIREELADELAELKAFADEASGYAADWSYGETLIADDHFEDYARELAEDIGAIDRDMPWPACHIDWEAAAEALQIDYTAVEFRGMTFWVR